jgi:glycosyltransferase involved in cell wall biosynthesis
MLSLSPSATAADPASTTAPGGDRLRILLLTDTSILSAGGSERFLRNLLSRLPPARYDVTVMQLAEAVDAPGKDSPLFNVEHVRLGSQPIGAVYGLRGWRALLTLRRMLREKHFDIVQSQHEKSDLLNALLPRMRGTVRISNRRDMGFNKSPRLRLMFRFINHRFDCVIAPAQPILSGLGREEALDIRQMLWIPNGVDVDLFRPLDTSARNAGRAALGLDGDTVAFGCVASFTPVKRHVDLIAAFAQVVARQPQARLLLVGDGPLRAEITAQIAALGLQDSIALLGNRSDIHKLLPLLDASVLASSTEGMSNALLEAMSSGLPLVATAVGGNLQLVDDDGNGLLVPVSEPAALAAALERLAGSASLRQRLGSAGRARIEREFSLDGMVRSYDRLYHRLLGKS